MRLVSSKIVALLFASFATACIGPGSSPMPTTADEQMAMTPDAVIADLDAGNERYVSGDVWNRDTMAAITASSTGQYPKAVILSCLDSRVPV